MDGVKFVNNIKIITDAACDFPKELIDKYDVDVVGMTLEFEGKDYVYGEKDSECISAKDFFAQVAKVSYLPKTASPSPDRIIQKYKTDEDVIIITLAGKLSATYSTANMAKNMYEEDKSHTNKIYVIDSTTGSAGCSQLVKLACELREHGKSAAEIVEIVEANRDNVSCYGILETLDNAIKGGRVKPIVGKVADILNIKAIVKVGESAVVPVDKSRGENKALEKVLNKVDHGIENKETKDAIICHANAPERAAKMKELLKEKGYRKIYVDEMGPVMGTYTGEGAIIVAIIK